MKTLLYKFYNAEGTVLWTKDIETNPYWGGYLFNPCNITFADINDDGYKEIIFANVLLDHEGNILYEYDSDYSIIGMHNDPEIRLILKKEIDHLFMNTENENYTACCKIVTIDGDIQWEKQFMTPTYFSCVEIESKKRLFFVQTSTVTELDFTTYEENPRITFDFDSIGETIPQVFEILDVDNNGTCEYVIAARDFSGFGNSALRVYDSQFHLIWEYTDHRFNTFVVDVDNNKTYEVLIDYTGGPDHSGKTPMFFRVLNHDKSERWTIKFDDASLGPDIVDIDADRDTEIIFRVGEFSLGGEEYLYVFDPEGTVEKQINISSGCIAEYFDFDGDKDIDILYYKFFGGGLRMYANSRFSGPLDKISGPETLEEVELGERGFSRDFFLGPSLHYTCERFTSLMRAPSFDPPEYKRRITIPLSGFIIVGVLLSLFLVTLLKKSNDWELLWGIKKVLFYVILLGIPPVGLVYLSYVAANSPEDYRRALGFIGIRNRQIIISLVVGGFLLLVSLIFTFLLHIHGMEFPVVDYIEQMGNFLAAVVLLILVVASIVEEMLFSGYLYPILKRKMGKKMGIILSSLIFSFLNLELVLFPLFFARAAVKMYAYERTHCIYIPVIIHFVYGLFVVILVLI
jgi:membrane protease YdiL (CAAX protease family)